MSMGGGADGEYRCFVGGLAWATDDRALQAAFRQFGEVVESKVINDRETGRSRGFGFVTFGEEQAMRDAIECMNGKDLDGRSITVNQAQSRSSGSGGGRGGFRRLEGGRFGNGGYNEERRGYGGRGGGGSYGGRERVYGGGGARATYSVGGGGGAKYGGPLEQGNWRK